MARYFVLLSLAAALSSSCTKMSQPSVAKSPSIEHALAADFAAAGAAGLKVLESRPDNASCTAFERPSDDSSVKLQTIDNLTFPQMVDAVQAPGSNRWYIVRRTGEIETFVPGDGKGKTMFLDLSKVVNSGPGEGGLLSMAWNPAHKGEFYLSYTLPSAASPVNLRSIIARFHTDSETTATYQPEELYKIEQPYENHNGGHIAFGKDGYLYAGFGDGGNGGDPQNRSQNLDVPFGKILRFDVNSGPGYKIPSDNPFINQDGKLPEIYAYGFRNPWRWSFDKATGDLWVGDVGQDKWEEIDDHVQKGGNYGWHIKEGFSCYNSATCAGLDLIDPVVTYDHGQGQSVTGGFVYRGNAVPSLRGIYLYADFLSGVVWGLFPDVNGKLQPKKLLSTGFNISSWGQDQDGELYLVEYGPGILHKIIPSSNNAVVTAPSVLSQTGCFATNNQPKGGLIPYEVNSPLWSDGASKHRWFAIPNGTKIHIGDDGKFQFPNGSVLVKEFSLGDKVVETRLFVHHKDGVWAGYTYSWREDGSDADLVLNGATKVYGNQTWTYPSQAQCLQCHNSNAGSTLGLEVDQIDRAVDGGNQLDAFAAVGLFDNGLPAARNTLPTPSASIDAGLATRSYLASNCSHCHRPGGTGGGNLDMRYTTGLKETGLCRVPGSGSLGINDPRIIAPGAPDRSVLFARISARGAKQMPPLATAATDATALGFVRNWIQNLQDCPVGDPVSTDPVLDGDTITLVSVKSNKCMDLNAGDAANGTQIQQWSCDANTNNQKFKVKHNDNGTYSLANAGTNKCIDVTGVSTAAGAHIQEWDCGGGQNQQVRFVQSGTGSYELVFEHSGKCLDVSYASNDDGAFLQQWDCGNLANQQWIIQKR